MMHSTRLPRRITWTGTGGLGVAETLGPTASVRRVVLELPRQTAESSEPLPDAQIVESFRVIYLYRFDRRAYAGICRVKFRDPAGRLPQIVGRIGISKVGYLAQLADGAYLANIEGRPIGDWARLAALTGESMDPALELTPDGWRISVVGSCDRMKGLLAGLRQGGMRYKVLSVDDADFEDPSPGPGLAILTAKQREALVAAYQCGYYDIPKRADAAVVARALALGKSTTLEHLRKAEKRLLDSYMRTGRQSGRD